MSPRFTILLPVIRPPALLPFAIESVLAQRVADFELVVICDGAPRETVDCAQSYGRRDSRICVLDRPKGARNGEAHRHPVLMRSRAPYAAHICDDDVWLPDHLEEMEILLGQADFGNLLHVYVRPDGAIEVRPGDLARKETRDRMLSEPFNIFGTSFGGYRLEAYRRLAEGWSPAPPDVWPDLHMWRKFLVRDDLRVATRAAITALHFASPHRRDLPLAERADETRRVVERAGDAKGRDEMVQAAWLSLIGLIDAAEARARALGSERAEMLAKLDRHAVLEEEARSHIAQVTDTQGAARDEIGRLAAERTKMLAQLDAYASREKTARSHIARVTSANATAAAEIGRLEDERAGLQGEIDLLAQELSATRDRLGDLLTSRSWRATAPLRSLLHATRRLLGR